MSWDHGERAVLEQHSPFQFLETRLCRCRPCWGNKWLRSRTKQDNIPPTRYAFVSHGRNDFCIGQQDLPTRLILCQKALPVDGSHRNNREAGGDPNRQGSHQRQAAVPRGKSRAAERVGRAPPGSVPWLFVPTLCSRYYDCCATNCEHRSRASHVQWLRLFPGSMFRTTSKKGIMLGLILSWHVVSTHSSRSGPCDP